MFRCVHWIRRFSVIGSALFFIVLSSPDVARGASPADAKLADIIKKAREEKEIIFQISEPHGRYSTAQTERLFKARSSLGRIEDVPRFVSTQRAVPVSLQPVKDVTLNGSRAERLGWVVAGEPVEKRGDVRLLHVEDRVRLGHMDGVRLLSPQ